MALTDSKKCECISCQTKEIYLILNELYEKKLISSHAQEHLLRLTAIYEVLKDTAPEDVFIEIIASSEDFYNYLSSTMLLQDQPNNKTVFIAPISNNIH